VRALLRLALVLLAIAALAFALSGCALKGAVTPNPTDAQMQTMRVAAVRAADAVKTALGIAGELSATLDQLPVSVAVKDRIDCGLLKVTGTNGPASEVVTRVCGPLPLHEGSPVAKAMTAIHTAGSCPSLRASMVAASDLFAPLLADLAASDVAALKMAGASLRVTLSLLSSGGVTCST
jgi:hypothetical protein